MTYTPAGLVDTIIDAQNNETHFEYDARGNRTAAQDAAGNRSTFTFDVRNRMTKATKPDTAFTAFAYDSRGRRTSFTDANSKVTRYAYDDADHLTSVTDAASNVTVYAYDSENNLTSITDALGRATSFNYDAYGRVTKTTFPAKSGAGAGLSETYNYDQLGNMLSKVDRKNNTTTYSYDALNRLTRKQYADSTVVDYTYDVGSRLTNVADATGTYQFSYDNIGRLTGTSTQYIFIPGQTFTMGYGYDAGSKRISMIDPQSGVTNYAYDTMNRITLLTNPQSQQFAFAYDSLSRRTSLTRPNGVNTTYNYDNFSRLLSVLHQRGGAVIDGATYALDNVGNRTNKTNLLNNLAETYTFDPLYQLTQVVQNLSGTATTMESYAFDKVGNRTASLNNFNYAVNNANQLTSTSDAVYTYDDNGNLLSKTDSTGTVNYTWDFENRLTSVQQPTGIATFKYDPFGRRIQKSSSAGTTDYLYDGANIFEEMDVAGSVLARYTQAIGMDEPLAVLRGTNTNYYLADGLGSITALTNAAGAVVASYAYGSFGNVVNSTGSLENSLRYTGREWDSETGLYYYRARYYDPSIGRFLTEDPIAFMGGINFYRYAANRPINTTDPSGLEDLDLEEANNDIGQVGYRRAALSFGFAREAYTAAIEWMIKHKLPDTSFHNGAADAFRHCFWSCTMARYLGEEVAETIANEHELANNRSRSDPQPHSEELMDRANNLAGRTCAANNKDMNCWDACTNLYNRGRLFGLNAYPLHN
jgi:RHS repeat-associated protein